MPTEFRNLVVQQYHEGQTAGHGGVMVTQEKIRRRFYWPGIWNDVKKYVATCDLCQRVKPTNQKPPGYMVVGQTYDRWEHVSIDLVGPLPRTPTGHIYILTLKENLTKCWVEMIPLRRGTAPEIAEKLVNQVFLYHGLPKLITSDNGPQFAGRVMEAICQRLQVKQIFTSRYHPQANSDERVHRELRTKLTMEVVNRHQDWDQYVAGIAAAIRDSVCVDGTHPKLVGVRPGDTAALPVTCGS